MIIYGFNLITYPTDYPDGTVSVVTQVFATKDAWCIALEELVLNASTEVDTFETELG